MARDAEPLLDVTAVEFGDLAIEPHMLGDMVRAARAARAAKAAAQRPDPRRAGPWRRDQGRARRVGTAAVEAPPTLASVRVSPISSRFVAGFARLRERNLLVPSAGFAVLDRPADDGADPQATPSAFLNTLGIAVCLGSLLVVYQLCGKNKPWLAIGAVMLAELIVLRGLVRRRSSSSSTTSRARDRCRNRPALPVAFIGQFISAGLMEELMKMTPALVLIALSSELLRSKLRQWTAIEPLDVILYACAAAAVFVMVETLELYVPGAIDRTFKETIAKTGSKQVGALRAILEGSQLAIVRTLNGVAGHLAYSGYFAYYVGLGLLRPRHRARLWLGGYLGAAALHGASNAVTGTGVMGLLLLVKLVTISFLVTAILNARKISPTRAENFATVALTRAR